MIELVSFKQNKLFGNHVTFENASQCILIALKKGIHLDLTTLALRCKQGRRCKMRFSRFILVAGLFLTCKAMAGNLSNVSTIVGSDPTNPNRAISCIIDAGLKASFPTGRRIVGTPYAAPVGNESAPEVIALFFVDRDLQDNRAIHEVHLKSTDHSKKWQIFQEKTEIGYFSTSVSSEAEIYDKDAVRRLGAFDISSCH